MAQPSKAAVAAKLLPNLNPERTLYGLRRKGVDGWVLLTYLVQGDEVIATTESEPDTKAAIMGHAVVAMERQES